MRSCYKTNLQINLFVGRKGLKMRKTFKKIAASVMAAATLAVGMTGMVASAASHSWHCRYIGGGAPSSEDIIDTWTMAGSTNVYTGKCTTMNSGGTTHKATLSSSSHTMTSYSTPTLDNGTAVFNSGNKTIKWKIKGSLSEVSYKATCYGNGSVEAWGTVSVS